jgi:hypothetical protein
MFINNKLQKNKKYNIILKNKLHLFLVHIIQSKMEVTFPRIFVLLGPAPRDRDYHIGSNFWKFYLI